MALVLSEMQSRVSEAETVEQTLSVPKV